MNEWVKDSRWSGSTFSKMRDQMYHEEAINRAGTTDPEFVTGRQWGGGWSQCGEIQEMVQPNTVLGPFWDPDLKNGTAKRWL